MTASLYKILVPVDFSRRNQRAIRKALEISKTIDCEIHLVHVVSKYLIPFLPIDLSKLLAYDFTVDLDYAQKRLQHLKEHYKRELPANSCIEISLLNGVPSDQFVKYIRQYSIDLVVLRLSGYNPLQRINTFFRILLLTRKTAVPIVTGRFTGVINRLTRIVLPLKNELEAQRIQLAVNIARRESSAFYIVPFEKKADSQLLMNSIMKMISVIPAATSSILKERKGFFKLSFSKTDDKHVPEDIETHSTSGYVKETTPPNFYRIE
jgi:nucleotide-binding universal stress UspA family protein